MSFSSNLTYNNSFNLSVHTNITAVTTITNVAIASQVLAIIDHYMEIILYMIGVCGALLNIFTFLQKQLRSNPCSLYFLAASFCDLCTCNTLILINIMLAFNRQDYHRFSQTSFWCKFSNYCVFMFPCLSSLYITFASIDRFCTSSRQARLRKLSSVKVSRIVIPCVFIIWGLFSLHIAIAYDLRKFTPTATSLTCTPPENIYTFFVIVDGFFFALFNGAIVPCCLAFFGIFIIRHVRQTRHRTVAVAPLIPVARVATDSIPTTTSGSSVILISRANLHLINMLLMQVCITMFLNLPYVIVYLNNLYHTETLTPFYLTVIYAATWFWYLNYCKTFYVNTLSSQFFRSILRKRVLFLLNKSRLQLMAVWSMSEHRHQT